MKDTMHDMATTDRSSGSTCAHCAGCARPRRGRWRTGLAIGAAIALVLVQRPAAQGDVTPPTITAKSPPSGTTGVSSSVNVTAIFSETIQPATLSFVLRNSINQVVGSLVSYDPNTRTATLNPNSTLAGSATFTATVSGVKDVAGNTMTTVVWSFTTGTDGFQDTTLPQLGLTQPTVIQFAPDGRVFVAQKNGRIVVYSNLNDTSIDDVVADLRVNVYNFWDRGLLGMALDPELSGVAVSLRALRLRRVPGRQCSAMGRRTQRRLR